ncbi:MAG TPA: prepilin peptidase [Verrucomicrobia bacterium]|nr:prepilin peptidase [Verrucomicrobiales bacterium]HIL55061.1 prepilin peptidase [Verrucomicrobiota bacterium]
MGVIELPVFLAIVSAILGATVGSFLNVVIYRVPRGLSVNEPRRSFCPNCKYKIPLHLNIPILSWFILSGKCKNCSGAVSFRYCFVEVLTSLLFLTAWLTFAGSFDQIFHNNPQLVLVSWFFISLLIAASFIDIEHQIIPDRINRYGIIVGIISAFIFPDIVHEFMGMDKLTYQGLSSRVQAVGWSFAGITCGFAILYSVVIIGKILFGNKSLSSGPQAAWGIIEGKENPILVIRGNEIPFEDLFFVGTEKIILDSLEIEINCKQFGPGDLVIYCDRLVVGGDNVIPIDEWRSLKGISSKITYKREAMGLGDVKFIAMFGAFIGWKGVLFALFAASIIGTSINLPGKILGKDNAFTRIPFGPYLAVGALFWLFCGTDLLEWYFNLLTIEIQ